MQYAKYVKEQYGREYIEKPYGFMTYKVLEDNVCHIDVLYVSPQYRAQGKGSSLALEMMSTLPHVDLFVCEIDTRSTDPSTALKAILSCGFKILDLKDPYIRLVYKREI